MAARNIVHGRDRGEIVSSVHPHLAAAAIIGGLRSALAKALVLEREDQRDEVVRTVTSVSLALLGATGLDDGIQKEDPNHDS